MNTFFTTFTDSAQMAAPAMGMMGGAYPNPAMMPFGDPVMGPAVLAVLVIGALVLFGFWIWMLVHAIKNEPKDQAIWILILMLTNFWGGIIYFFAVKRKMDAKVHAPHHTKVL